MSGKHSGKHSRRAMPVTPAADDVPGDIPMADVALTDIPIGDATPTDISVADAAPMYVIETRPVPPVEWDTGARLVLPATADRRRRSRTVAATKPTNHGRRRVYVVGAVIVVIALLVTGRLVFTGRHSPRPLVTAVSTTGATQTTLLIQLSDSAGAAVDSALVANDQLHRQGVMLLVPSQVISQVPGFGSMPFGQTLTVGDAATPSETLSDLIGVTVDGSWVLNQSAMAALVDKLGGITVTVNRDVTTTSGSVTTVVIPTGTQKLDGASAVAYATFLASGEAEQARLARFNAVLTAVLAGLPKSVDQLSLLVGGLGGGSVSSFTPARLAGVLAAVAADDAADVTDDQLLPVTVLDPGDGQQSFSVDAAETAQLVNRDLADSVPSNRKTSGNRVLVENLVGTPDIGESTRTKLAAAGFVFVPGPNAPGMPNATALSEVLVFSSLPAAVTQGDAVAQALGLPNTDVLISNQQLTVADVIAIIGADYKR